MTCESNIQIAPLVHTPNSSPASQRQKQLDRIWRIRVPLEDNTTWLQCKLIDEGIQIDIKSKSFLEC